MFDAKSDSTNAKTATQSSDEKADLSLTDLVPPPKTNEVEPPNNWEFKSPAYTSDKYLNNLMIEDVNLNRAVDGYFAKADLDANGYVDKSEIDKSKEDKSITGEEDVIRSMLDGGLQIVQKQSNDEWGKENDGATRSDVTTAFDNWMKYTYENEQLYRIPTYIPPIFNGLDTDGNGFLTKEELTNPDIPKSNFAKELRGALAANLLKENFDDVSGSHDDGLNQSKGVSLEDALDYSKRMLLRPGVEDMYKLDKIFGQIALS